MIGTHFTHRFPNRKLRRLQSAYSDNGPRQAAFAAARYVARRTLPPPHDTRTRVRLELLEEALTALPSSSLPLTRHLSVYRHGFDEQQYHLYELGPDPDDWSPYLSKFARQCARGINDDVSVLKDKERFHDVLAERGYAKRLPDRYGIIDDGRFEGASADTLDDVAARHDTFMIKQTTGGGGNAVYVGRADGGDITLLGKGGVARSVDAVREELDRAVVTEFCRQADYAETLYPHAANTVRLLTMQPPDEPPFIAAAAHRIGTDGTRPLDNFSQGDGGLSAEIDVETGELSAGATMTAGKKVVRHDCHPETDARITRRRIPGWESIAEAVRSLMAAVPEITYAGWDLLVTAPGEFVIVEGNHYPGPAVHQVHRPLLADERVRSFYEAHSIPVGD